VVGGAVFTLQWPEPHLVLFGGCLWA